MATPFDMSTMEESISSPSGVFQSSTGIDESQGLGSGCGAHEQDESTPDAPDCAVQSQNNHKSPISRIPTEILIMIGKFAGEIPEQLMEKEWPWQYQDVDDTANMETFIEDRQRLLEAVIMPLRLAAVNHQFRQVFLQSFWSRATFHLNFRRRFPRRAAIYISSGVPMSRSGPWQISSKRIHPSIHSCTLLIQNLQMSGHDLWLLGNDKPDFEPAQAKALPPQSIKDVLPSVKHLSIETDSFHSPGWTSPESKQLLIGSKFFILIPTRGEIRRCWKRHVVCLPPLETVNVTRRRFAHAAHATLQNMFRQEEVYIRSGADVSKTPLPTDQLITAADFDDIWKKIDSDTVDIINECIKERNARLQVTTTQIGRRTLA